jgi:hypothetical protein
MASESVKKVQEILFRGGRSNSGPSTSPQNSAPESPALTIQIPDSIAPRSKSTQLKPHKRSTDDLHDQKKTETHRAALRAQLKENYHGAERYRLEQDKKREKHWKKWGPYVSDRQWVSSQNFGRSTVFEKANRDDAGRPPSARTIRTMVTPGVISPTSMLALVPIDGVKTV